MPGDDVVGDRPPINICTASDRVLLVEAVDLAATMGLYRSLEQRLTAGELPGVSELIPAARTIMVRFDPLRVDRAALAARLSEPAGEPESSGSAAPVTIAVHYDGADLADVSALLGISTEELIARHVGARWQVAFSGFAPGFGYLVSDDPIFDVPRRATPRTRVPSGAVGLAGSFSGVYPRESPGGWQLIGHTDAVLWDLARQPPALLTPGTPVRFVRAPAASERVALSDPGRSDDGLDREVNGLDQGVSRVEPGPGEQWIEVVRASPQLLIQDLGRPGHAALGVSASGAVDRSALRAANRLVGNQPGAAALEILGGAAVLRFHGNTVAALTGARMPITITGENTGGVEHGRPFAVADGDELQLGVAATGIRGVLAVRGGIRSGKVLGSRATDTLSGLGPAPLRAGEAVPLGDPHHAPDATDPAPISGPELPAAGDLVELDLTLGPRDDWFTAQAVDVLTGQEWLVTPQSDRIGIRLHGEARLVRARTGELPSEAVVTGAIQVPPDGQPVLFLADHPLTGGYPVIAAVTDRCLDLAGQLPPGVRIRFRRHEIALNSPRS